MRKELLAIVMCTVALAAAYAQQSQNAKTEDGRTVLLSPDGTWKYAEPAKLPAAAAPMQPASIHKRSAAATKKIAFPHGRAAIWIDPEKWVLQPPDANPNKLQFNSKDGTPTFGMVMSEGVGGIPTSAMKQVALVNAHSQDPEAAVTAEEHRTVNGRDVLCLEMRANFKGIKFHYYGYYFGGAESDIQVLAMTLDQQFDKYRDKFTEFLDGFEIYEDSTPETAAAPVTKALEFNDGHIQISYSASKWQLGASEGNRRTLRHSKDDAYVLIIPEQISMSTAALADFALENARKGDPDVKLISREARRIEGVEVVCMKFSAAPSKVPLMFYGCYYGGPVGAVQVLCYTGQNLFAKFEDDFSEVLNSLRIKP